jgi:hypothetical protein
MQVQGQNYVETVTYPKQVMFTVAHTQDSAFSRDGGKTRINKPKHKNILHQDRCVLTEKFVKYFNELWGDSYLTVNDKGMVTTMNDVVIGSIGSVVNKRRIKGQNSIFKTEQEKLGIPTTIDDAIYMLWGELNVDFKAKATDKGLWIYLMTHNANEDYELRDPSISSASFKIQDDKRNAEQAIENRQDKIQEAREIVYSMRDKKTKRFDKDKVAFYTNVFRQQISGFDNDEQKFITLLQIADTTPEVIITSVNNEEVEYIQVVQEAIALNILVKENTKFINTYTKNTVVTYKVGTPEEKAIEKIVKYYSGEDGTHEFEQLRKSVEAVKLSRV